MKPLLLLLLVSCAQREPDVVVQAPAPPPAASWVDPVTGARWVLGKGNVVWGRTAVACADGWRRATAADLEAAWTRGLSGGVVWAESATRDEALTYDLATGKPGLQPKDQAVAVAGCVK